jgi:hypothetical protein
MSKGKTSIGILFLGILIGVIAGMALALWLNNYNWDNYFFSKLFSSNDNSHHRYTDPRLVMQVQNETAEDRPVKKHFNRWADTAMNIDSESIKMGEFIQQYPDCVISETYYNDQNKNKIVLAKEQLLYTCQIKIEGFKNEDQGPNLDSLLLDDHTSSKNPEMANVEFWKSPINYIGYKWSNQKLVLFGLYNFNNVKLKYSDDLYYMQYGTLYYALETSTKFHSMVVVGDNELIKKLNNL